MFCKLKLCIATILQSSLTKVAASEGSAYHFKCNKGYKRYGVRNTHCDGQSWSHGDNTPVCTSRSSSFLPSHLLRSWVMASTQHCPGSVIFNQMDPGQNNIHLTFWKLVYSRRYQSNLSIILLCCWAMFGPSEKSKIYFHSLEHNLSWFLETLISPVTWRLKKGCRVNKLKCQNIISFVFKRSDSLVNFRLDKDPSSF